MHLESALTRLVNIAEEGRYLKKEMKENMHKVVSDIRNIFTELLISQNDKAKEKRNPIARLEWREQQTRRETTANQRDKW